MAVCVVLGFGVAIFGLTMRCILGSMTIRLSVVTSLVVVTLPSPETSMFISNRSYIYIYMAMPFKDITPNFHRGSLNARKEGIISCVQLFALATAVADG